MKRGELRQALLDAGLEALRNFTPSMLITGLGVRALARRAGASPAGFYHHFPTVDDYAAALIHHVYDPRRTGAGGIVHDGLRQVMASALPAEQAYRLHESELTRVTTDPEFRVRLGLWALGGAEVDDVWRDFLRAADDQIAPSMTDLVASWGRELRPPLTPSTAVATHVALVQGAAIRHLIDPERLPPETFRRVAAALSFVQLRLAGDTHTLDDRLAEINYYPTRSAPAGVRRPTPDVRRRIIEAAEDLFSHHGLDNTSVAQLARRAKVSPDTVYAHFGSKTRLAVELFLEQSAGALPARPEADPDVALRAHLFAVAVFVATKPDTTRHYVDALVSASRVSDTPDPIASTTQRLVAELVSTGWLRSDIDTQELATCLLWAVCRRMGTHPAKGPTHAVDRAWKLMIEGARAPSE